ncbi:MAG: type II toxin-antitoxin system RelE/ParE family toxin [Planctomycetaceae bacterium]
MIALRFHPLATAEFREARAWYEERDRRAADRFTDAVQAALQQIRNDPQSHPIAWKWFRSVTVSRFPYRIFFEQLDAT